MTEILATYKGVRVRVLEIGAFAAFVQALEGEPFEFRGTRFPYHLGHTAFWSADVNDLTEVDGMSSLEIRARRVVADTKVLQPYAFRLLNDRSESHLKMLAFAKIEEILDWATK